MAVRFRKYFSRCKGKRAEGDKYGRVIEGGVECEGKRGKHCPQGLPMLCGAWSIEFRDPNGRWVSKVYPEIRNRTEAVHFLSIIRTDILRKKFSLPCERAIPTLKEYTKRYLELCKNDKENTFIAKQRAVNILAALLGDYKLDKLNDVVVEKYIIKRQDEGIKPGSINEDVSKLKHILSTACKEGILNSIPCNNIKKLKVLQTRDRVLSSEEITVILKGDSLKAKDRLMILVSFFTGMRLNEVVSLKWSDVDFTRSLISFIASKTGKLVTVPLSSYLASELQAHKANSTGNGIFENKTITRRISNTYSAYFIKVFKKINFCGFSFHGLRHTFLSLHGDMGTGAFITKELAGHSTLDMTLRYTHVNLDHKRKAIEAYTGHVLNNTNKVMSLKAQKG
ncbi:MAG: site-specific integrase [Candidatus Brocadiaceae bacterium]|nr:site-specific integrase [Candidatus Brocadiaceae bacterium]